MDVKMTIVNLWESKNQVDWKIALDKYGIYVKPENKDIEHELNNINSDSVKIMNKNEWYEFLLNKYFKWKFTVPDIYIHTTKYLKTYKENNELETLYKIKEQLFQFDKNDIKLGLEIAKQIKGLGVVGASGLLTILFPLYFGTVDQFVVKALNDVFSSSEESYIKKIEPKGLKIDDGAVLITIMRNKSDSLNKLFQTDFWTPRKIDMILWSQR